MAPRTPAAPGEGRFTAEVPGFGMVALHVGAVER